MGNGSFTVVDPGIKALAGSAARESQGELSLTSFTALQEVAASLIAALVGPPTSVTVWYRH